MSLPSFAYQAPTIVWFSNDGVARLASYLKRAGIAKALLVCDPGLVAAGLVERVRTASGGRITATWADVEADAPRASIEAGAAEAKRAGVDGLVALGGGSAIDSAKAIALLARHGGDLARWDGGNKVGTPGLPLLAIPTTAGTGSEASNIAVVKDDARGRKLVIFDRAVYPAVAILDPTLTVGLPPLLTAATGIDALTHAVEGMVSTYAQPICTAIGLECVRLVKTHLARAVEAPDDLEARGWMLLAASMAGQLVSMTFSGVAHAVAHALGIGWKVHHGTGNAIALPWSIRVNAEDPGACAVYARCAEAFGESRDAAGFADEVEALVAKLGLPTRLSAVGIAREDLERLAALAFADPSHGPNPVKMVSADDLRMRLDALL